MAEQAQNIGRRTLLSGCIVLLLCGIAAECFLLFLPEAPGSSVQQTLSSQAERDPAKELTDALRQRDYDAAAMLLETDLAEEAPPEEALTLLQEQIAAIRADYAAGSLDGKSAANALRTVEALGISEASEAAASALEQIRLHEAALLCSKNADAYAAAGDYTNAIAQYQRIPRTETELFSAAKAQIAACKAQLVSLTAERAAAALSDTNYESAEQLLRNALETVSEDETLIALLEKTVSAQKQITQLTALQQARVQFDAGEYTAAFETLSTLPESQDSAQIAGSYRAMYLLHLQTETETLLKSGEAEKAAEMLTEAEELVPDAEILTQLRAEAESYAPVPLGQLEIEDLADFSLAETAMQDCFGTEYSAEDGNLFYSYEGTLTGRQSSSAVFLTDGGYSRLTVKAAPLEDFSAGTVLLEISADGRMLETYAISRESGVLTVKLDITGAKRIRLRVFPYGNADLRAAGVLLAEGTVQK